MKKLPRRINLDRVSILLGEEQDQAFFRDMAQHIIEDSFKAFVPKMNVLAVNTFENARGLYEGDQVWPFECAKEMELINYCINCSISTNYSLEYSHQRISMRYFDFKDDSWECCEGITFDPNYEGYGCTDVISVPKYIQMSELFFYSEEILSFFELEPNKEKETEIKFPYQDIENMCYSKELDIAVKAHNAVYSKGLSNITISQIDEWLRNNYADESEKFYKRLSTVIKAKN